MNTREEAEEIANNTYYYPHKNRVDWLNHRREILIQVYNEESQKTNLRQSLPECLKEFDTLFNEENLKRKTEGEG